MTAKATDTDRITSRRFHETVGAEDWRIVGEAVCAQFHTDSFAAGARLVQAISELSGVGELRPVVDLRDDGVAVRLFTFAPGRGGLSRRDVELARRISVIARDLGLSADPAGVQNLVVSVDALTVADVLPFWRAVLGYIPRPDAPEDELNDPHLRGPVFFFNQMDAPRSQRNRIHVDVWVPHDQAAARVEAAIAAGGRLVTDAYAPGWWVLADAEGNEACVATCVSTG